MVNHSIFQPISHNNINSNQQLNNELLTQFISLLKRLLEDIENITEYSPQELKDISILSTFPQMQPYIKTYTPNKKHIKRKHAQELITALEKYSTIFNGIFTMLQQNNLMNINGALQR